MSSSEYPTFKYNNNLIIIKPGEQFTSNQLRKRLNLIDINTDDIQNKSALKNIYDSSIKDDNNKIKLIHELLKDTEAYNSYKSQLYQKNTHFQQIPTNIKNSKEMNISYNRKVELKRANKITDNEPENDNKATHLLVNNNRENNISTSSFFNKHFKKIIFHISFGCVVISSSLGLLYIYRLYTEEINKGISRFINYLINNDNNIIFILPISIILFLLFLLIIMDKNGKKNGKNKKREENYEL